MKTRLGLIAFLLLGLAPAVPAGAQSNSNQSTASQKAVQTQNKTRSAGGNIGSGSGDIGKGVAKGTGNLAAGTGKGAADLVTLHPVDASAAVGKGGASAGKNIAVGSTKGTEKIFKGVGRGIKHIF